MESKIKRTDVALENELKETFDSIHLLMEKKHKEEVTLELEALVAIINRLLNVPKVSFVKLNLQNDKGIEFLTEQLIKQIKNHASKVVEEIFYYIPRLQSYITPDISDSHIVF